MEEKNEALQLLEIVAGRGLKALGQKLQQQGGKNLIMADRQGIEHYPETVVLASQSIQDVLAIMPDFDEQQYFYTQNQQMLVFKITLDDFQDNCLFLFWQSVAEGEISTLSNILANARLALKWHLRGHQEFTRRLHEQRRAFFEGVFVKHNISVETLLKEQGIDIHHDREYAVMLMDIGSDIPLIPPADFRARLMQAQQSYQTELLYPLEWNGCYLVIISGIYSKPEFNFLSAGKQQEMYARCQQLFSEVYKADVSIGVGTSYPLSEIHRSYREARISLTFRQIKGEKGFVQEFAGLGIFRELFSCEQEQIISFCRRTLDKLLAYDHDYDAGLLITLQTLLDTNFNYKLTAEKLFIHVNTVRYRCDKIAQLLDMDLTNPDTRFNLYAAIRVGDVLKALNLIQPGYIGNLSGHKNGAKETRTLL